MAALPRSPLSEQLSLVDRQPSDVMWSSRLATADPVATLGETFVLNGLATPTRTATTGLLAPQALAAVSTWLAEMLHDDDVGPVAPDRPGPEAPVIALADLAARIGLDVTRLPGPYAGWRLTTELYVLHGRSVYLLTADVLVRYRQLADPELGIVYGRRLLPFLPAGEQPSGAAIFVVVVPARTAALGGLRGYRRGLLDAGRAVAELAAATEPGDGRWLWETEFYDDACARVLEVDGVDRIPVAIGMHLVPDTDEEAQP